MLVMLSVASVFSTTANNLRISDWQKIGMITMLALIFAIVFGMRWDVGKDNLAYLYSYQYLETERYEWIFKLITESLRREGIHYSILRIDEHFGHI